MYDPQKSGPESKQKIHFYLPADVLAKIDQLTEKANEAQVGTFSRGDIVSMAVRAFEPSRARTYYDLFSVKRSRSKITKGEGGTGGEGVEAARAVEVPSELLSMPGFPELWSAFVAARQELKKPLTARAAAMHLKTLSERPGDACALLSLAIKNQWRGLEWAWLDRLRQQMANTARIERAKQVETERGDELDEAFGGGQ